MTEGECPKCGEPGIDVELTGEDVVMDSTGKKVVQYIQVTGWICPNCTPGHYTRKELNFHGMTLYRYKGAEWRCPKCGEPGLTIDEYDEDVVMDSTGKKMDRCVEVTKWICPDCVTPSYYTRRKVDFRKSRACDDESEGEE